MFDDLLRVKRPRDNPRLDRASSSTSLNTDACPGRQWWPPGGSRDRFDRRHRHVGRSCLGRAARRANRAPMRSSTHKNGLPWTRGKPKTDHCRSESVRSRKRNHTGSEKPKAVVVGCSSMPEHGIRVPHYLLDNDTYPVSICRRTF